MPRKKRCTYYEYRLLAYPKARGRKMPHNLSGKFLEAILECASKLDLEVVGGCYPRPTREIGKGKSAKQHHPEPKLFHNVPKEKAESAELLFRL